MQESSLYGNTLKGFKEQVKRSEVYCHIHINNYFQHINI